MTGKQNAVLWIGLVIVALNLILKWPSIRAIIFTGSGMSSGSASSGGGNPSVSVPLDPFLPNVPFVPHVTVPIPKL